MKFQNEICSGCGQLKSECFDEEGPQYEVDVYVCRSCEARGLMQEDWAKERSSHGAFTVIEKVP